MSQAFVKTKASFLEAGLPCASLSAECQRDNNARQRPPQNRLHIWWARRPPTICRAAILAALLPHDLQLDNSVLPPLADEPTAENLDNLPPKLQHHRNFFERLLREVGPTPLTREHQDVLRALGIMGDADRAYRRMALREESLIGNAPIMLPMDWTYRYVPAFQISPSEDLIQNLIAEMRSLLDINAGEPVIMLDSMAGGGSIPLEGTRYGLKVYANELNFVSAMILKGTLEYPARFGRGLLATIRTYVAQIDEAVRKRLLPFFYIEPPNTTVVSIVSIWYLGSKLIDGGWNHAATRCFN